MQCPRTNQPTTNMMQFPQEMMTHIAGFMADDLQAVDPSCYRSARSLQALWRGYADRNPVAKCLCRYVDRSFWGEVQGTNVFPGCATVWEEVPARCGICDCTHGCRCPSAWDDFDLLESPREGPSPIWHWPS